MSLHPSACTATCNGLSEEQALGSAWPGDVGRDREEASAGAGTPYTALWHEEWSLSSICHSLVTSLPSVMPVPAVSHAHCVAGAVAVLCLMPRGRNEAVLASLPRALPVSVSLTTWSLHPCFSAPIGPAAGPKRVAASCEPGRGGGGCSAVASRALPRRCACSPGSPRQALLTVG